MSATGRSWIGLGILAVVAAAGIIALTLLEAPQEEEESPGQALEQNVPKEDVRALINIERGSDVIRLRITQEGNDVQLQRNEQDPTAWEVVIDGKAVPARSEKVEGIITQLQSVISQGGIVRNVSKDEYVDFGLDESERIVIELGLQSGAQQSITIGDVDFQGVYAYAKNEALADDELALVPIVNRSVVLIDSESIQQGTGEDRVEE